MTISNPLLVGLIGRKRAGKDTFAAVLVEEFGFARIAFADPLKAAALTLDPIVGRPALPGALYPGHDVRLSEAIDALGWEAAKDSVPEVRSTLQKLGEAIRTIDDEFWISAAMREVEFTQGASTPVVITDVRYRNEADEIRDRGGVLLRVARPAYTLAGLTGPVEHISETALDDYDDDSFVLNDGTLEDLRGMARYFGSTFA
jgi:hypothetical protein